MRRWGRRILWGLLGAIGAAAGGFLALLYTVDPARLSSDAARELSQMLGQEVRFSGSASVGFWPLPGIDAGTIETDGGVLTGGNAVIVPHPWSLLTGHGDTWTIVLVGSDLALGPGEAEAALSGSTMRPQGMALRHVGLLAARVRTGPAAAPVTRVSALITLGGGGTPFGVYLTGDWRGQSVGLALRVADPRLLLDKTGTDMDLDLDIGFDRIAYTGHFGHDPATGQIATNGRGVVRLTDPKAVADALGIGLPDHLARLTNLDGSIQSQTLNSLLRVKTNLAAQLGARMITLQGRIEGDAGWREKGPSTLSLVSRGAGLFSAYLEGAFDGADSFSGTLQVSVADVPALQDLIGIPTEARLIQAVRGTLRAALVADEAGVRLSDGEIRTGERAVATAIDLKPGDPPSLSISLDLPDLDLTPAHQTAFARLRNGLAWIESAGLNLALMVKAASTRIGSADLGTLELGLTHRAGIASVEIARFDFLDGLGNARLQLATAGPARLTGTVALAEVDAAALSEFTGLGLLSGTAAGDATFEIPDIANPLVEGIGLTGIVSVTDGHLRLPVGSDDRMAFDLGRMRLRMAAGRVVAEDIVLERDGGQTTGEIAIALPARTLSGNLIPPDGARLTIAGRTDAPTTSAAPPAAADKPEIETATPAPPATAATIATAAATTDDPAEGGPGGPADTEPSETGNGAATWADVRTAAAPQTPETPDPRDNDAADADPPPEPDAPEASSSSEIANVPIPIPAPR